MSFAGSFAMPASFLGSGRVFVSLPVHFMHASGIMTTSVRHVTGLVYLAQKHERFTGAESVEFRMPVEMFLGGIVSGP